MADSKQGPPDAFTKRLTTLAVMILFAFGLAVPTVVLFFNGNDKASVGPDGTHLNKEEVAGRELFSKSCFYCHAMAATKSYGRTGPDLDVLLKPMSNKERRKFVEAAILEGEAHGTGQMPALLYRGKEARDVAKFVAAVAGVGVQAKSVEPGGYPELVNKAEGESALEAYEPERTPEQLAAGAAVFTGKGGCEGCHTLAAAKATGNVGPNLDELKPSYEWVKNQVTHGGTEMPHFGVEKILTPVEIEDVAKYVSSVAGTK